MKIPIALIDDNEEILKQFSTFFLTTEGIQISCLAVSVEKFVEIYTGDSPLKLLFLDIDLPGLSGLEALPSLKELLPDTDIIMFTVHEDSDSLIKAFCSGATGYLLKSTPIQELHQYIHIIQSGGSAISAKMSQKLIQYLQLCSHQKPLTILNEKEYQVLELLAEGWSYKLIANKAGLSTDGVRFYIKRIYRALNVNSKGEALRIFYKGEFPKE
jgi:DNA-binding NarL/FixJ family response regulator